MKKISKGIILLFLMLQMGCHSMKNDYKIAVAVTPYTLEQSQNLYSQKELGFTENNGIFIFRVFAPRATQIKIAIFEKHTDTDGDEYFMLRDNQGVWEYESTENLWGKFYGYTIQGATGDNEAFDESVLIADPYSKAVVTQNHYTLPAKSLIHKDTFDWENDSWVTPEDSRELIIYETHLADLTKHSSSAAQAPGTYLGVIEPGIKGGLEHIKKLGVNAVEFLPLHDFGNIEIPYNVDINGVTNTWNPYARNHWGYMTSYFFAPESYYASNGTIDAMEYNGSDGRQVDEFKTLVKAFHKENIAVLMDVVYNHVSQYDYNPLKLIDKKYYFNLDENGDYLMVSGCGNDFNTKQKMARKLIVDSILYWMKEYHIDGFRFDLAAMIDEETLTMIRDEARKVNPNVIIIAEPWGGGYMPDRFSELDWVSWNDRFRNGIKGQNTDSRKGYIFGRWDEGLNRESILKLFTGTLKEDKGLFQKTQHSVNYLESHDDNTFGDFIRFAIKKNSQEDIITDYKIHSKLTADELELNKLGAFILATSQGVMMLHSGQEFARSKVIAETNVPDDHIGRIDHNSYNKDNETNYINYDILEMNSDLVAYYSKLIKLRKRTPELRSADRKQIRPVYSENCQFGVGYEVLPENNMRHTFVLYNSSPENTALFILPDGKWDIFANQEDAAIDALQAGIVGQITLSPRSAMVLMKHN